MDTVLEKPAKLLCQLSFVMDDHFYFRSVRLLISHFSFVTIGMYFWTTSTNWAFPLFIAGGNGFILQILGKIFYRLRLYLMEKKLVYTSFYTTRKPYHLVLVENHQRTELFALAPQPTNCRSVLKRFRSISGLPLPVNRHLRHLHIFYTVFMDAWSKPSASYSVCCLDHHIYS